MSSQLPELAERLILDGTKVGWWPDRIAAWERGERIAPITCDVAMTRACNYACGFCYASLQASEGAKVTRRHFFDMLDDMAEIGVKGVSFISDGESTVVPWYAEAVEHAANVGLKVGAGSNGLLLTKDVLERVLPHLSYLRFNFSAGERKRYAAIMGVPQHCFDDVIQNIKDGMEVINKGGTCKPCEGAGGANWYEGGRGPWLKCEACGGKGSVKLSCTLNMQMVCDPKDGDQIVPFARLVTELRPTYGIIKHCADDVVGSLGVDYSKYEGLMPAFDEAERIGKEAGVRLTVKRSRLDGKRSYTRCFGPPFILQVSGNGLVSSCGFHFNEKYKKFHMGNITEQRFKTIWESDRYWEIVRYLASEHFNPQDRCGPNCLQHNTNDFLFKLNEGTVSLPMAGETPMHPEFI